MDIGHAEWTNIHDIENVTDKNSTNSIMLTMCQLALLFLICLNNIRFVEHSTYDDR